jgi:hypothetical protein
VPSYLVQEEDGTSRLILEDSSGDLLLEESVASTTSGCHLLLEDGTGSILLEDGSYLLQEECGSGSIPTSTEVDHYAAERRRRLEQMALDDEDALLLILTSL